MYRVAGDPSGPRPVLYFMGVDRSSEIRATQVDGDFWHLRNLEVQNPSDNGVNVAGSNNILELLAVHDCGDTGIQISGTNSLLPSHNKVINCDSYMNANNSAENADGFAAKLDIGPGNVFYGCRAWYNVDDGWDHFEAGKNSVIMTNCWSFGAKHPTKSKPNSDGNGFKMGGQRREIGWYDVLPADTREEVPVIPLTLRTQTRSWARNSRTFGPRLRSETAECLEVFAKEGRAARKGRAARNPIALVMRLMAFPHLG